MNVYQIITNKIIEELKKGTVPWRKTWRSSLPQNLISKKEYRGINSILLNSLPFESPYFLTFRQTRLLGGSVRRGEKGFPVIFWQFIEDQTSEERKRIPFLRYYTVFNVLQTSGIEIPTIQTAASNPIKEADKIIAGMPNPPSLEFGGNRAAYFPSRDLIRMPRRESFTGAPEYYTTIFHELTHSTGHATRLGRKGITGESIAFGTATYSQEELVGELGASFLSAKAGIIGATIENSASYISSWLKALLNDQKMIILAASQAQKAADYILNIQFQPNAELLYFTS